MNVAGEVKELGIGLDQDGFVAAFEELALAAVVPVVKHSVADGQGFHEAGDIGFVLLVEEEMEVVGHEAVAEQGDVLVEVFAGRLGQFN